LKYLNDYALVKNISNDRWGSSEKKLKRFS
jgi:hypothetical protein